MPTIRSRVKCRTSRYPTLPIVRLAILRYDDQKNHSFYFTKVAVDFREMTHSNDTCFPKGSLVTLCCTASADRNRFATEILSSKGTVINSTIGVKNTICVVVSTPGVYTCAASLHHIVFVYRTLTVCIYRDNAFLTGVIVSCVVIGALLLVLLFTLAKFIRRNYFRLVSYLMVWLLSKTWQLLFSKLAKKLFNSIRRKKPLLSPPKTQGI